MHCRSTTLHSRISPPRNKCHTEFRTDSRRDSRAGALGASRPISWRKQAPAGPIRLHRRRCLIMGRWPLFAGRKLETRASTASRNRPNGTGGGVEEGFDPPAPAHSDDCLIQTSIAVNSAKQSYLRLAVNLGLRDPRTWTISLGWAVRETDMSCCSRKSHCSG